MSEHDKTMKVYIFIILKMLRVWFDVTQLSPHVIFSAQQKDTPATFQNDVTHWWDGSQLYGSSEKTSAKLRSFKNGKMKVSDEDGLLPVDSKTGIDQTGEFGNLYAIAFSPSELML